MSRVISKRHEYKGAGFERLGLGYLGHVKTSRNVSRNMDTLQTTSIG